MKRRRKKNKDFNINQNSFYFEDYLETNQKKKKVKDSKISQDRVYLLFFLFFSLVTIFSIKIVFVSLKGVFDYKPWTLAHGPSRASPPYTPGPGPLVVWPLGPGPRPPGGQSDGW